MNAKDVMTGLKDECSIEGWKKGKDRKVDDW